MNDDSILIAKLNDAIESLREIKAVHDGFIFEGNALQNHVDHGLVGQVFERLRKLHTELELNEKAIPTMIHNFELRRQGAADLRIDIAEFRALDKMPTEQDRVRVADERMAIENELSKLSMFLESGPFYDTSLLVGTALRTA